jgi:YVTN family beta-propeller protein
MKICVKRFAILIAGSLVWASCKNNEMSSMTSLNINYPAAFVVNGEDNTVSVINTTTNQVSETIRLNGDNTHGNMDQMLMYPHHVYLSPDKSMLSLGVPGMDLSEKHGGGMAGMKGKFALLSAATGMITKVVELPAMNHNAVFSPDGREIWTSQMQEEGKVLVYDANTYALKSTVAVGKEPAEVTFSADGKVAFVANGGDNSVTAIDPSTKAILKIIAVGTNPVAAWTGSDGKMYVDNEDGKSISIIDVAKLEVVETIDLGFMPGMAAYNGQMKELWVSDPNGGKVHWWKWDGAMNMYMHGGAFETGAGTHAIAFKGMNAYVTNQAAHTVSVADVMTHAETKEIPVGKKPNGIVLN